LISGAPGIGKTSAIRLLSKKHNYELIETNSSDIRNKENIEQKLKHLIKNRLIGSNKFIVVMDEVDGMSSGDRGGIAVLIQLIKETRVPIVCICNDR